MGTPPAGFTCDAAADVYAAVEAVSSGEIVYLDAGDYVLDRTLLISKAITLRVRMCVCVCGAAGQTCCV